MKTPDAAWCHNCGQPVIYDHDSGCWIHSGFEKVDGRNGLYCSPEMWNEPEKRVYAKPVYPEIVAVSGHGFAGSTPAHASPRMEADHGRSEGAARAPAGSSAQEHDDSATERMWREHAEALERAVERQDAVIGLVVSYVDDLIDRARDVNAPRKSGDASGAFALYAEARLREIVKRVAEEAEESG